MKSNYLYSAMSHKYIIPLLNTAFGRKYSPDDCIIITSKHEFKVISAEGHAYHWSYYNSQHEKHYIIIYEYPANTSHPDPAEIICDSIYLSVPLSAVVSLTPIEGVSNMPCIIDTVAGSIKYRIPLIYPVNGDSILRVLKQNINSDINQ